MNIDMTRLVTADQKAAQALAILYAKQLKAAGGNVFDPKLLIPPAFKEMRVAIAAYL